MVFKRAFSFILTLLFLLAVPALSLASGSAAAIYSDGDSGEAVIRIQLRLRELGYLCYPPTGVYRAMTVDAVKAFQERCGSYGSPLAVDGRMGPESMKRLFDPNAPRVRIPDSVHMPRGPIAERLAVKGQLVSWSEVKTKLSAGRTYTATDCNTGSAFRLVFAGGENHAEMQLASDEDAAVFLECCGGEHNFLKRPIVVDIDGIGTAASMLCMPHGAAGASAGEEHICVFFYGSLSHVGNLPDIEHDSAVLKAASQ